MDAQLQLPPIINQSDSAVITSKIQMANNGETSVSKSDTDPNPNTESHPQLESIDVVISLQLLEDKAAAAASAASKGFLRRDESYHEQCRVCQEQAEEQLIELGCKCRGDIGKAHQSCIQLWFQTRGSNTCEICQQVAVNVPPPNSQPSTNYWVWRVDSGYGGRINLRRGHARGCSSPLWIAFTILIGGLLLDILISVSLRVSAIPVNIIIGVLVILGLATAFRLGLECCHEWSARQHAQRTDLPINNMAHPAV